MEKVESKGKFELGVKRFYLPIQIKRNCPNCDNQCVRDLSSDYLSYPTLNAKEQMYFYCEKCGTEFEIDVILQIGLQIGKETRKV